jgi:hypothetical protein
MAARYKHLAVLVTRGCLPGAWIMLQKSGNPMATWVCYAHGKLADIHLCSSLFAAFSVWHGVAAKNLKHFMAPPSAKLHVGTAPGALMFLKLCGPCCVGQVPAIWPGSYAECRCL